MSMRKTVELATKPKRAAPKAKYIDPIVQATFSQDGQLQEIVRTLATRLRDPNTTVVFKSLITLHTLMRSGSIDTVFPYLASSSISLTLSSQEAPNLSAYGRYLGVRIKAYGNLKRDVVRDKSDRRAANRLRKLTVEQGLLRETREIQRLIAALVESKFYTEDVDDDVSMTALRLLVKDLLVLFTAVNEGVINVLENFFGMSQVDATMALKIYRTFCRDTEKVVAYLGTAKKLYHVLNIPIPNLRHAPLSLANSLEEYLNDPNFEQNRQEYRENKRIADGGTPRASTPKAATNSSSSAPSASAPATSSAPSSAPASSQDAPKSFTDFFESIESNQTPMFDPSMQSPQLGFLAPQMTGFNPFMAPQPTGMPFGAMPSQQQPGFMMPQMTGNPFLQPQMTGFTGGLQPQMTGMGMPGANPFRQSMMMTGGGAPNPFGQPQGMMMPQATGMPFASAPPPMPAMQQPQATGFPASSPFNQAPPPVPQLAPQATGNPFGGVRPMSMMPTGNPFQQQQQQPAFSGAPSALGAPASSSTSAAPFSSSAPPVPTSSAPAASASASAAPTPAPLVAQKTGARNPFAPAPGTVIPQTAPPAPKMPSMNELAANSFAQRLQQQQTGFAGQANGSGQSQQQQQQADQQQQQQQPKKLDAFSAFLASPENPRNQAGGDGATPLIAQKTGGLFASIASDLARTTSPGGATPTAPFSSASGLTSPFSSLSLSTSTAPFSPSASSPMSGGAGSSAPFLTAQTTGFGGSSVKPFQPTSSFGATLASEFGGGAGPNANGSATSPSALTPQYTGFQPTSAFGASLVSSAPSPSPAPASSGATATSPLQPQATGYNPFGGTKLPPLNTPLSAGLTTQPTGAGVGGGATGSLI
ncbi:hypothetical protein Rhopal_004134-T1 [Rhodotorula paludigena]|uniref:ENTH domain-containing protein n=1 Tax=Rhodotorula paludigena TaxID=86838 RepID=A0AAV5GFA8_9BASI|nr:hypothetical protein Rhopal_004134-T1 [Rhodotorula paludigena]